METIFQLLHQTKQANQRALDQVGRVNHPTLCTVTDNSDPEGKRRIRVSDPAKPGLSSDWLRRLTSTPYEDAPLPPVGSTVMALFDGGDETRGWYLECQNATNPNFPKESPQEDLWREVPGSRRDRTDKNQTISVGQKLRLQNDAGAYLELHESGAVILGDAFGNRLVLGGQSAAIAGVATNFLWEGGGGNCTWDLNGGTLSFADAANITINGSSIIVVGSTDSDNDINNTRGY